MNLQQRSLPELQSKLANLKHRAVGALGEDAAYALLERAGYEVSKARIGQRRGDLRAVSKATGEVYRVEVKTARRGKDGKWRFTLVKDGHTDCRDCDVLILLAVLRSGRVVPFVVPVTALGNRKTLQIGSHPEDYAGQWARYRQSRKLSLEMQ